MEEYTNEETGEVIKDKEYKKVLSDIEGILSTDEEYNELYVLNDGEQHKVVNGQVKINLKNGVEYKLMVYGKIDDDLNNCLMAKELGILEKVHYPTLQKILKEKSPCDFSFFSFPHKIS